MEQSAGQRGYWRMVFSAAVVLVAGCTGSADSTAGNDERLANDVGRLYPTEVLKVVKATKRASS